MSEHFTSVGTREAPKEVVDIIHEMVIEPTPNDADDRMCVQVFDREGKLVQRTYGQSPTELQKAHDNHECHYLCPICEDEAMKTICAKNPDTCDSIPPGSCGPDCHGFESKY